MAQFGHVNGRRKKSKTREKMVTTKRLKSAMETDKKRKARLEKIVATTKSDWPWRQRKNEDHKMDWIGFGFNLD